MTDVSTTPAAEATDAGSVTTMPISRALNAGLRAAMAASDRVLLMGEDIGKLGGVFRVTEGLQAEFGDRRVLDTPLAESGIVGTAIGLAMAGFRPVIEIQFDGFVFPAFDQITTQLAKLANRHEGSLQMPIVIRIPYGGHIGAVEHHQESPETYFAHTPGLRVVSPSTANDAYWMIQDAIESRDPVIFLEPKAKYWQKGEVDTSARALPLHASRVVRRGTDVTLVGHGAMVTTLLQAAVLAEGEGTSCEVIDLRSLSPVDYRTVTASVRKTGRVVVTHEAAREAGVGAELIASVTERCFTYLEAAPARVTGHDIPYPPAKLEKHHVPDLDRILDAVDRVLDRPNSMSGVQL